MAQSVIAGLRGRACTARNSSNSAFFVLAAFCFAEPQPRTDGFHAIGDLRLSIMIIDAFDGNCRVGAFPAAHTRGHCEVGLLTTVGAAPTAELPYPYRG